MRDDAWYFDLEGYVREGNPDRAERADAWQTAIGLQDVDGLRVSDHLLETAREHIEGAITIDEAQRRIVCRYESIDERDEHLEGTKEADIVSSRIVGLLGDPTFSLSPARLRMIHRTLFEGLLPFAGSYRTYDITKKEWVLRGDTVLYASADAIEATLDYDFSLERGFSYRGVPKDVAIRHVASFVSGVWQIHPFAEGNTRTTALFALKYLASLGYAFDRTPFKRDSWYFRNALVRANYENHAEGVRETREYIDRFFENLSLGGERVLDNRCLRVDWNETNQDMSA